MPTKPLITILALLLSTETAIANEIAVECETMNSGMPNKLFFLINTSSKAFTRHSETYDYSENGTLNSRSNENLFVLKHSERTEFTLGSPTYIRETEEIDRLTGRYAWRNETISDYRNNNQAGVFSGTIIPLTGMAGGDCKLTDIASLPFKKPTKKF